jgi:hypothetical protein
LRPWLGAALAAGAATAMVVMVGAATASTSGSDAAGALAAPTTTATATPSVVPNERTVVSPGESAAPVAPAPNSAPVNPVDGLVPPQLGAPEIGLGSLVPMLGMPISHVDDEAKADDRTVNGKAEVYDTSDEKDSVKIYNAALANDDEDKNFDDSSEDDGDYDKSFDDNSDNGDNEGNDDGDNEEFSKNYDKNYGKDDGDDDGGNDDDNSGPSPQVSNAPVGGVAAGDGTTSPASYVIGALALAGMGGAAAVTARRSSRRRMGRHEA